MEVVGVTESSQDTTCSALIDEMIGARYTHTKCNTVESETNKQK